MAQLTTLARPYAKAAFETAVAADRLMDWSSMLGLLAALAKMEQVASFLAAPSRSAETQALTLIDLCSESLDKSGQNFVRVLANNKRLSLLPEVFKLFEELKAEREKTIEVEVISAFSMDAQAQQKLSLALKNRLKREIRLNTRVDKFLIGGIVVRAGDLVIDGSIRGKLNKLAETMNA